MSLFDEVIIEKQKNEKNDISPGVYQTTDLECLLSKINIDSEGGVRFFRNESGLFKIEQNSFKEIEAYKEVKQELNFSINIYDGKNEYKILVVQSKLEKIKDISNIITNESEPYFWPLN